MIPPGAGRRTMPNSGIAEQAAKDGPLVGVRVIDLGTMFAAPFGATLMGDFGAGVIKVELPGVGDSNRGIVPIVNGVPVTWTSLARNKRSITLDIRKERGKEILLELVAMADIVIENFRPGTLERWGLGYETLKEVNPGIILVRVSGYGQTGPYKDKAGFGTPAAAFSGLTYMQGYPDRPPVSPPLALADYVAGTYAAMAAMMALRYRDQCDPPEGQEVDVSLYEPLFRYMDNVISDYAYIGKVRERSGLARQGACPAGTFETKDGKFVVMVTSTDRTFNRLAEVMGRADMITDPRYSTNAARCERRQEVTGLVQQFFLSKTMDELMRELDENGVPICPINSMADCFENPQFVAREDVVEVDHPVLGKARMVGIVPKFSKTPGAIRFTGAMTPGEHNLEVYRDQLGLSEDELEALKAEEVI